MHADWQWMAVFFALSTALIGESLWSVFHKMILSHYYEEEYKGGLRLTLMVMATFILSVVIAHSLQNWQLHTHVEGVQIFCGVISAGAALSLLIHNKYLQRAPQLEKQLVQRRKFFSWIFSAMLHIFIMGSMSMILFYNNSPGADNGWLLRMFYQHPEWFGMIMAKYGLLLLFFIPAMRTNIAKIIISITFIIGHIVEWYSYFM
jgi:cobalamin synthase